KLQEYNDRRSCCGSAVMNSTSIHEDVVQSLTSLSGLRISQIRYRVILQTILKNKKKEQWERKHQLN
ncbi:hypothetical protein PSX78_23535, partial [Shigella flexneri]|nr:hypothetical protein [Shigella flexneri]